MNTMNTVGLLDWDALLKASLTLFAIVNPIGSIPIFLQLTGQLGAPERRRAFVIGAGGATAILVVFVLLGEQTLTHFFQVQLSDLMAAGGLLLLLIAIDHLVFGCLVRNVTHGGEQDPHHLGAVPIACPILAGPGAMMSVLLTASQSGLTVAFGAIVAVFGVTAVVLLFIDQIYRVLGRILCTVLSKILCLFIAAVGIRLLMTGIAPYFK